MWWSSTSKPFARRRASLATPSRSSKRRTSSSPVSSAASGLVGRSAWPWLRFSRGRSERNVSERRKLVVFVPREALESVRDALFAAGAGRIGNYERCSWYTAGTGTFLGGEATDPSIGERGREERVPELP